MDWTAQTEVNDYGNDGWANSDGRFYAPTAGIYSCSYSVGFMDDTAGNDVTAIEFSAGLSIRGNSPYYSNLNAFPGGAGQTSSTTVKLDLGDYLTIMIYANLYTYRNNYSQMWFSCHLVTAI